MADTVPAMLEPGEYVIRKDAVDKIGVENLDMMNNIDRSSQMYMSHGGLVPQLQNAHSAIDELLALNTLANQDNVDMTRESSMMNKGGQLKPIPKDNKGLGKLPATVRNRMGYMQEGGKVPKDPDPLQIDARMRGEFKDVGTIGIVNPKRNMMSELSKLQDDISMIKFLRERFKDNPENMRAQIRVRELPNMEDIMEILNEASKMTKPKSDTIRGYQTGGYVPPSLQSIFEMSRLRPVEEREGEFREFDTSLLDDAFSDFTSQAENLQRTGSRTLGQALRQTRGMGNFSGSGFADAIQDETRRQAEQRYQSGLQSATQMRDANVQSMFDDYTTNIIGQLSRTSAMEGTEDITDAELAAQPVPSTDPNWNPPSNPAIGTTYNFGSQVWERKNLRTTRGNMKERWVRIN